MYILWRPAGGHEALGSVYISPVIRVFPPLGSQGVKLCPPTGCAGVLYHLQGVFEPVYNRFSTTTTCPNLRPAAPEQPISALLVASASWVLIWLEGHFRDPRDKLTGATGRTEPHYYAEPGAALALWDTSGRFHGRWSPGHDRAWSS
jgi:hypothetical protein